MGHPLVSRAGVAAVALLLACCDEPAVTWRETLRAALYERTMPDGKPWGRWDLDPPLNQHTRRHLLEGASRARALEAIDGLLAAIRGGAKPLALEAALIQRDLWPVHDWASSQGPGGPEDHAAERSRLARAIAEVMSAVAIEADEIPRLPATMQRTVASRRYPTAWDRAEPAKPFLPEGIEEAGGVWVCLGDEEGRVFSPFHLRLHEGRSSFETFVRLPGGLEETRDWIAKARERLAPYKGRASTPPDAALPDPPAGTLFALVRRALLVDRGGRIHVSPVVESLQLRVHGAGLVVPGPQRRFDQPMRDQPAVFEWRLTPGGDALAPVGTEEVGFVDFAMKNHDPLDPDKGSPPGSVLAMCVGCHDGAQRANSILSLSQQIVGPGPVPSALFVSTPGRESARFAVWKASQRAVAGLRDAFRR